MRLSAQLVCSYVERGGDGWIADVMVVDAIAKRIEEIAEAARRISPLVQDALGEVPWHEIRAMRNLLTHDYPSLDLGILSSTSTEDIPALLRRLDKLLG